MAPTRYLNQCWSAISDFLWHSSESNFTANAQATILYKEFENYTFKQLSHIPEASEWTHWGWACWVMHIFVGNLSIIGSDNDLSPGRRQALIWTNAGITVIGPLGTNFSEILIEIHAFSFTKMHLKMSPGKRRPSCLSLIVLRGWCSM